VSRFPYKELTFVFRKVSKVIMTRLTLH